MVTQKNFSLVVSINNLRKSFVHLLNFSVARFNSSDYFKQESNGQSKARLGKYLVGKSFGKSF